VTQEEKNKKTCMQIHEDRKKGDKLARVLELSGLDFGTLEALGQKVLSIKPIPGGALIEIKA